MQAVRNGYAWRRYFLAALAVWVFWPGLSAAASFESFRLQNGLEVILIPNHRMPAVSHTVWYRAGSADDPPGKSGLAHYLEHMMFLGTRQTSPGQFSKIITRRGGNHNAFTSRDFTGYYVNIAKQHLPLVMSLEADRMANYAPPKDKFLHEREVIIEERRMRVENDPASMLSEQMQASLLLNHPYRLPIIGWKHEMERLAPEDVRRFHSAYYSPSNAVVVVAGDVTLTELKALTKKYYGPIPSRQRAPRRWLAEPSALASRRITLRHPQVRQAAWSRRYVAPSFGLDGAQKALPFYVLAQWLGGGDTSRLYRSLVVRQKLATQVSAGYDGLALGPGDFEISAVPADGVTLERLEKAIDDELQSIAAKPPSKEELQRARTLLKAELFYARDGLQPVAYIMGHLRMIGLPASLFDEWPLRVDKIALADVVRALSQLRPNASVTGILLPAPITKNDHAS